MIIIGVDFHPEFQQIAVVDTETGELQERRLGHPSEAESFYRELAAREVAARVGMEKPLQNKAARWLGAGVALDGHDELAKFYFLLGLPQTKSHLHAYNKAKALLHKIPVKHDIIEEDEAQDFATEIAAFAKAHGVIP